MLNHRQKVCIYDKREMKEVLTVSIEPFVKSVIAEWYSTCAVCLILFCNLECIGNVRCPFICPCHAPMIIMVYCQWTIQGMVTCSSFLKRSLLSRYIRRFVHSRLTILDVVSHERLWNLGRRIVYRLSVNQPS